jgi:hypothetical protein
MSERTLEGIDTETALRALVVLAAAERAERDPSPRVPTERLLYEAGLSPLQIGVIFDEKAATIKKRLERAEKNMPATKKAPKK